MIDFISAITIRARAAFYLAVSEDLFDAIKISDEGYSQAREALDKCWLWLEGKQISGNTLYEYLANENDTGVATFESMVDDPSKSPAWNTLVMSLAYVIWQEYKIEGEKYLPADIEEVSEAMIDEFLAFASESENFNKTKLDKLEQYLLNEYASKTADEQGNFIRKNEIMGLLDHSSQNV
jgi:hypothetical protein